MRPTSKATSSNHCGYEALDWCNSNSSCDNCDRNSSSSKNNNSDSNSNGVEDQSVDADSPIHHPKVSTYKTTVVDGTTGTTGSTVATVDTTTTTTRTSQLPTTTTNNNNKKLLFPNNLFAKRRQQNKHHHHHHHRTTNTTNTTATNNINPTMMNHTAPFEVPNGTVATVRINNVRVESSSSSSASTASSTQPDDYMVCNTSPAMTTTTTTKTTNHTTLVAAQLPPQQQLHHDRISNNNNNNINSSSNIQAQQMNHKDERFLGPIDLDTLSEEDLYTEDDDDKHDRPRSSSSNTSGEYANVDLVTTNTSDIFASILPTNDSTLSKNEYNTECNNNDNDTGHTNDAHMTMIPQQVLETTASVTTTTTTIPDENEPLSLQKMSHSSTFQPILQMEDDFGCFTDCNTLLLSSLMMMASPSTEPQPPQYKNNTTESSSSSSIPTIPSVPQLEPFPDDEQDVGQHFVAMNDDDDEKDGLGQRSVSSDHAAVAETETTEQILTEHRIEEEILPKNPSISSSSTTTMTPHNSTAAATTASTTTTIDPLLLLLQQSSFDGTTSPKRHHPQELDAMLVRVLQHKNDNNDDADETTTVASTDLYWKKDVRSTTTTTIPSEEPTIDDVGGLMGALAAGPVDVDDFIPEDSYWAMDTHEFILDELELSRQLIGYHEGCEPPMINDISLLTDDDDDEEEDNQVPVLKKVAKRDVRQDLILQRTSKMTRQRTSATADSNELIRRSQAIQHQQRQQQYIIGGVSQRPATITQKNRNRSDPSVIPSRIIASSQKQQHPTTRFPTPTIVSRQKQQRQQVSPPRNRRSNNDPHTMASTKLQMQQQQRKMQPNMTPRDVTSISQSSNYHHPDKRLLYPTTPTTTTAKGTTSSFFRVQPPSPAMSHQNRNKNFLVSPSTGPSSMTRSNPTATTALASPTYKNVQQQQHHPYSRRVVDIDLSYSPKRIGTFLPVSATTTTTNDGAMNGPVVTQHQSSSSASSPFFKYSTTAAEV